MDLDLNEEQEMLREMVRGVCSSYANLETVRELEDDPVGYPAEFWKQMAALDLIGLMIPAEYGGSEMSALEGAVVYKELGRALAPSPHFVERGHGRGRAAARRDRRAEAGVAAARSCPATRSSRPAWLEPGQRLRRARRADAAPRRRRRLRARRRQVARAVRAGGDRDRSCWPAPATPTPTSTCSSSIRPRPGVTLEQQLTHRVGHPVRGDAGGRARAGRGAHRRARVRVGPRGTTTMLDGIIMLAAQADRRRPVRARHHRAVRQGPRAVRQAARCVPGHRPLPGRRGDRGRRRGDARVRSRVGARERPPGRPARADGEAVRVQDLPRRHRDGAAGLRRRRLHRRVRHPALLPPGQAAADLVVGRPRARGARREHACSAS